MSDSPTSLGFSRQMVTVNFTHDYPRCQWQLAYN